MESLSVIVVHHLNNSRSQRVLWLLEELGLPYEIKRYQRDPKTMLAPPELRAVHPLGKSPVIEDDGLVLAESGAILGYLGDRYGSGTLMPAHGTPQRLRCDYWLHYAEGSLMPPLLLKLVFRRVESAPAPFFVRPVAKSIAGKVQRGFVDPQIALHLDYLEAELGKHEWFGGEAFGVADIALSFPLEAATARAGLDASRPRRQPATALGLPRTHPCTAGVPTRPGARRRLHACWLNASAPPLHVSHASAVSVALSPQEYVMSTRRDIEQGMDELGDRMRRYAGDAGDAGDAAHGWIARGRRATARFDGDGYRRRLARAAEDLVDETNYRYRRLKRQVNRHPIATAAIVAGTIGAFLLLRRVLRDSDED